MVKSNIKRFLWSFIALSWLALTACGGNTPASPSPIETPPGGGSGTGFSGTILAPAGGDVANTLITACLFVNGACDPAGSRQTTVSQAGPSAAFTLEGLEAGQYVLFASKDTNGNGAPGDAGDYEGFYTLDGQAPAQISPPSSGLTVQMAAIGGATPAPPPGTPPGGNDLSGTVSAPAGGDVAQTVIVACFLEAGQCNGNSPNTKRTTLSTAGETGSFTVPGLVAGQYIVGALKDIDGNNNFADPVDYYGCYGDGTNCIPVTPPQAGLDIQMTVDEGTPDPGSGGTGSGAITGTIVSPGARGASEFSDIASQQTARQIPQRVLDQVDFTVRDLPAIPTGRFVPGDVIVKFKAGTQQLQSLSAQGVRLQRRQTLNVPRAALYHAALDEQGTLALIRELNARPDVVYAEPNTIKTIQKVPNDELYTFQWHYEAMNLPAAWDITDGVGSDVTVAVIDTGALAHPDLQGIFVGGYDFVSDPVNGADGDGYDADPTDLGQASSYHGAHVAGTIAASTNNGSGVAGVSWGAKVLPIRVLGVTGSGSIADITNGVLWAAGETVEGVPQNPNPAQVINLSLGGPALCSQFEQEAFDAVRAKGITVVVAAGNENSDVSSSSPANCDGVIAVGATGPQNTRAPYSNYGAGIDIMAPGGDTDQTLNIGGRTVPAGVLSTVKDDETGQYAYVFYPGTSMATPHVSGLVALMLAQEPGLTPDTVLTRLQASATPLSADACERPSGADCGAGLVDAAVALGSSATPPDDPTDPNPPTQPPVTGDAVTYAAALYCIAQCSDFDIDLSRGVEVSADALDAPYSIDMLVAGTYIAAAWQDLNGDQEVSEGEPFGQHFNALTLGAGETLDRADIYLQPFTPQAASQTATLALFGALEQRASAQPLQNKAGDLRTLRNPTLERALERTEQLLRNE